MAETVEEIRARVREAQKDYGLNLSIIESILLRERGYASHEPYGEDAVVLYSGGLDSTVMIDMVIKEWNVRVHPLMIRRGAKAEKHEEEAFDYFVDYYRKKYPDNVGEAAKIDVDVPPGAIKGELPKEYALTVGHPMRNSTMQNIAVMYATALASKGYDVRTILTGSVGDDNTEPEQGLLSLRSQTLNTCISTGDWRWQITSPLTDTLIRKDIVYKKDLITYAIENGIPLERTRTCFGSDELADGTCFACVKRKKAFEDAKAADPARYMDRGEV